MTALRALFRELLALLRGSGAALSVSQCEHDLERVRRDLERAIAARDRQISVAGIAAAPPEQRRPPSWLLRPDTGGASVTSIKRAKP